MKRIDFYVQHLLRHDAKEVQLVSGKPVKFKFPSGDRESNSPLEHSTLAQLVQEAAPAECMNELMMTGKTIFEYTNEQAGLVTVRVEAAGAGVWKVAISPGAQPDEFRIIPSAGGTPGADPNAPAAAPAAPAASANRAQNVAQAQVALQGADRLQSMTGFPPLPQRAGGPEAPAPAAAAPVAAPQMGTGTLGPGALAAAQAAATAAAKQAAPAPQEAAPAHNKLAHHHGKPIPDIRLEPGEPKINRLLRMLIALKGSDLHLSSENVPLMRCDGEIVPVDPAHPVIRDQDMRPLLMEIATERASKDFGELWDADFAHMIPGVARFRANYFMDRKGMGAVFRQIPFTILSPEKLGIPPKVLELCYLTKGLVVVTGPTGSGKSTTLATLMDVCNTNRSDHIITIEDPIEFVHENKRCLFNQREVNTHTKGFKSALRAALREDPDIVLVGEMRDLETIAIAIETAETGHLVFGTLHTTTAPGTVNRVIDQFPADRQEQIRVMLSESLRGVIAQVLCKKIGGGRVAAYEVLIGTSAVGALIREGKTFQLQSVMQTGRALGMQTMNDHLLEHVRNGLVEPKEAYMKCVDKAGMKDALSKMGMKLDM